MLMQELVYLRIRSRSPCRSQVLKSLVNVTVTTSDLSGWQGLVFLLSETLATPPSTTVLANAQPAALLAVVSLAVVLADARPTTRRIACTVLASFAVVLADA